MRRLLRSLPLRRCLSEAVVPRGIYLDFQATTPIDPRVLDCMLPYQVEAFGNPHSLTHDFGTDVGDAVEAARVQVASLINAANPLEVIFTSGATESNNTAIKGVCRGYRGRTGRNHIITTTIEHKCVLNIFKQLEKEGFDVTFLPVQENGLISLEALEEAMTDSTLLVSTMAVNNEIGVIQPLSEIGELCQSNGTLFHSDAAQGLGKIPLDVQELNIDLLSMSSHKVYGPKGIGGLYVRGVGPKRVRVDPVVTGGGQERGLRGGTLPSFLCVGFGEACEIAGREMERDLRHVEECYEGLYGGISERLDEVYLNGDSESRYKGNLNLSFAFVEGEALMLKLGDVYVSSGSACTSATLEPSHVLAAIGIDDALAHTSIRFGFGRFTTMEEVEYVVDKTVDAVEWLRELSSTSEMVDKGIDLSKVEWKVSHH